MKKIKNKIRVCGNCSKLRKHKWGFDSSYNGYRCDNKWWSCRPNNEKGCEEHEFKIKL